MDTIKRLNGLTSLMMSEQITNKSLISKSGIYFAVPILIVTDTVMCDSNVTLVTQHHQLSKVGHSYTFLTV